MGNSSHFRFDDDNKTKYIYSLHHPKGNGQTENTQPTYCIMDKWENIHNFTHTLDKIYLSGTLYVQCRQISLHNDDYENVQCTNKRIWSVKTYGVTWCILVQWAMGSFVWVQGDMTFISYNDISIWCRLVDTLRGHFQTEGACLSELIINSGYGSYLCIGQPQLSRFINVYCLHEFRFVCEDLCK